MLINTYQLLDECINHSECKTVVQGYHLDNPVVLASINKDYDEFYDQEIIKRKDTFYPPFSEVNRLIIVGQFKDMYYCANYLKKIFSTILKDCDALGPVYLQRYKGVQVIIKHNNYSKVLQIISEVEKKFSDKKLTIQFERYPRSFN